MHASSPALPPEPRALKNHRLNVDWLLKNTFTIYSGTQPPAGTPSFSNGLKLPF